MNTATLIGHLGAAPKVEESKGTTYAQFSLATNERWTDRDGERKERTDWHRAVAFNGLAKTLGQLGKGDLVAVEGKLRTDSYEKDGEQRTRVQVVARAVHFLRVKEWEATAPAGDLIDALRELPLGIERAMYVEGGPEAQLFVRARGEVLELVGSYETGFNENDDNARAWPVPNVVAISRRGAVPGGE